MLNEKLKDPAFWERVRTASAYAPFCEELKDMWERECGKPVSACKYSEFILFDKTGSRDEYETSYFLRRRQMNTAALLAMIYPEEPIYIDYLIDVIWAISDEYTWVLPAHMPTFRAHMVEHIDLFSAETGFALAEIDYALGDRLPALIRSRIKVEINHRIIENFLHHTYHWESVKNNWAAVCLGSVVAAFMYQRPELVEGIMPRVERTIDSYLQSFPRDGICVEGFGYWHYGYGFFLGLADMLYQFTDGRIDYFKDEKVRAVAGFIQKMFLDGDSIVSFSDGGLKGRYHIGMLHYLKEKYPQDITILPRALSYTNDRCGRWCLHSRAILWFNETLETTEQNRDRVDYMPSAGWFIKVTPTYALAAKGGNNGEPHNHNDLGAFLVVKGGRQLLTDPGSGTYTKAYFREGRYKDFRASSRGHCVPIINGQQQVQGRDRKAVTAYGDGIFTVEYAAAYDIPALTSLRRTFRFTEGGFCVEDCFTYDGSPESFIERFVATAEPKINGTTVTIDDLVMTADDATTERVTVTEETYAGVQYYCIDYHLKSEARHFTLHVQA